MPPPIGFDPSWALSPLLRELPFAELDDILRTIPEYLREDDNAVRDAIFGALMFMFARFCSDHVDFASGTDEVYATGDQLDYILDGVIARRLNEEDDPFRERGLVGQGGNSPAEILAAVKAIIAPFTSVDPYYYELPDDGIFIGRMSVGAPGFNARVTLNVDGSISGNVDGFYFAQGVEPIVAHNRYYSKRGQQTRPRWAFLEGAYRGAPSPFASRSPFVFLSSPVKDGSYDAADYSDVFSIWGKAIIGIPPFPFPGVGDPAAPILVARAGVDLVDASGNLTLAVVKTQDLPVIQATASIASDSTHACFLESANLNAALVVDAIQAMLNERLEWGCRAEVLLDPTLV